MVEGKNDRVRCRACLSYNEPDARFCYQCGRPFDGAAAGPALSGSGSRARSPAAALARGLGLLLILAAAVWGGVALFEMVTPGRRAGDGKDGNALPPAAAPAAPAESAVEPKGGGTDLEAPPRSKPDTASTLTPDALLERTRDGIRLFVGLNRAGEEVARCAVAETAQGLAIPASALKGSYMAWIQDDRGRGYEIRSALFCDDFLGSALVRPEEDGQALPPADPAALGVGDRIFQIRPGTTKSPAAVVPGLFGGNSFDEVTGAARCLLTGAGPDPLGSVLVDGQGRFLGLAPPAEDGEEAVLFIPSTFFDASSRAGSMTLDELNALYYEGSFDALVREARSLLKRNRLREALGVFDQARLKNSVRGRDLEPKILNLSLNIADTLLKRGLHAEALEICAQRSVEFPFSTDLLVLAFDAAAKGKKYAEAAQWIQKIRPLNESLYNNLKGEHVAVYLQWSGDLLVEEQRRDAIDVVREGLYYRHDSPALLVMLGDLLKSARDFRGAAAAFQRAMVLDPDRTSRLEPLIRRCAELQDAPGAVSLDFDPKGSIRCRGLLDGKVWVDFIVDTGASYTSIPAATAEELGIDVGRITRKTRISTAGGERVVPYVLMGTVDVSGLVVKEIFVLVNDLSHPEEASGLLGLNFLNNFQYTVDHESGRMVLRSK